MRRISALISTCARRQHRAQVAFLFALICSIGTVSTVLFSTLHLVIFVDVLGLTANEIVASQMGFFVWNMANDLIGGVLVHVWHERFGSKLSLVLMLSVAYVVTSCFPFFPAPTFLSIGAHYFITICLVDGFGSILIIARGSMIEDVSEDESHRLCMQRWDMIFGVIEFLVKAGGFALFDAEDMSKLQVYIVSLAFVSVMTTLSASIALQSLLMAKQKHRRRKDTRDNTNIRCPTKNSTVSNKKDSDESEDPHNSSIINSNSSLVSMKCFNMKSILSLSRIFRSFLRCKEFYGFVGASVVDEAHRTFNDQFRPIIVDIFLVAGTKQHRSFANTAFVVVSDVWRFLMINFADCSHCTKSNIVRLSLISKIVIPPFIFFMAYMVDPILSNTKYDGVHGLVSGLALQLLCELTLASGPGTFFVLFMTNLVSPVLNVVQRSLRVVRRGGGERHQHRKIELSTIMNEDDEETVSSSHLQMEKKILEKKVLSSLIISRDPEKQQQQQQQAAEEKDEEEITSVLSLMWAFHALIAKPLNSVGPVLGAYYLIEADIDPYEKWNRTIFLLFLIPIVTGIVQLCFFQIHCSSASLRRIGSRGGRYGKSDVGDLVGGGVEEEKEKEALLGSRGLHHHRLLL